MILSPIWITVIVINVVCATDLGWSNSINTIPPSYYHASTANVLRCEKLCERQIMCIAVTFDARERMCYMHNEYAYIGRTMVESGYRGRYLYKNFSGDTNFHTSKPDCQDVEISVPSAQKQTGECIRLKGVPEGYIYEAKYNLFYRINNNTKRSWHQQRDICKAEGGHLITVKDEDMYKWLAEKTINACVGRCQYAIDGTDEGHEGVWTTHANQPIPWTNWMPRQPNNLPEHHCLFLEKRHSTGFNDLSCSSGGFCYHACQIDRGRH